MNKILLLVLFIAGCGYNKKECDYKLPEGYRLVKNGNGQYAIRVGNDNVVVKVTGNWIVTAQNREEALSGFNEFDTWKFKDSCTAKSFAKEYIEYSKKNTFK